MDSTANIPTFHPMATNRSQSPSKSNHVKTYSSTKTNHVQHLMSQQYPQHSNQHHSNGGANHHIASKIFRPADSLALNSAQSQANPQRMELPLRILVPTSTMGAVIGKGGVTIKQIIAETMTRIDVHRNHGQVPQEKIVSIYGSSVNCSKALNKIMDIVRNEELANKKGDADIPLRILAHNAHVGRVIGKNGATINEIMKDTNTRIGVSNISWNYSQFLTERVITIQGQLQDQIRAEQQISSILRIFYAKEMMNGTKAVNNGTPTNVMHGNSNVVRLPNEYVSNHLTSGPNIYAQPNSTDSLHSRNGIIANNPSQLYFGPTSQMPVPYLDQVFPSQGFMPEPYNQANHITASHNIAAVQLLGPLVTHALGGISMAVMGIAALDKKREVSFIHIPQSAVGPIIGKEGTTIREIIQFSGANIKISSNGNRNKNKNANAQKNSFDQSSTSNEEVAVKEEEKELNGEKSNNNNESIVEEQQLCDSLSKTSIAKEEVCKVMVVGIPEAQAKAQYLIFRAAAASEPDGVFKVEIHIPTAQAGRIIGRNGYTVKELQLYTNARIKIGDDNAPVGEETPVYITGDYISTQTAQRQIRALVNKALNDSSWKNKSSNGNKGESNDSDESFSVKKEEKEANELETETESEAKQQDKVKQEKEEEEVQVKQETEEPVESNEQVNLEKVKSEQN